MSERRSGACGAVRWSDLCWAAHIKVECIKVLPLPSPPLRSIPRAVSLLLEHIVPWMDSMGAGGGLGLLELHYSGGGYGLIPHGYSERRKT